MPLDRTDFAILEALQNNARLSNKELAARVGLAPSSCLARTRRLIGSTRTSTRSPRSCRCST